MTRPVDFKSGETFGPAGSPPVSHRFLLETGLAKRTVSDYKKAVLQFLLWCESRNEEPEDYDELDDLLTDYIHEMYVEKEGKGRQHCANAVFGIQMLLPRSAGYLVVAQRCLKLWSKAHPSVSYPPLTWELAVTVAVQMVRAGYYRFAVATVLGFDCLLRINELLSLRSDDVVDASDSRVGRDYRLMSLRIRKAKTGTNQSVDVWDGQVKSLLRALVGRTKRDALLFPGGDKSYRRVFKACCADLGLSPLYVPHSLRHGGATRLYLQGVPLENILIRGRWAATKSARRYIQSLKAIAIATSVPRHIQSLASIVGANVIAAFAQAQKH